MKTISLEQTAEVGGGTTVETCTSTIMYFASNLPGAGPATLALAGIAAGFICSAGDGGYPTDSSGQLCFDP